MIKINGRFYCLLLTVAALCLCTKLPPHDLQMINFGTNPGNPPLAPVISSIVPGDGSLTVYWNTVSGATSYNLYYKIGTSVDKASGTMLTGATSPKQVSGLTNGTQYAFAVSAVGTGGESALSAVSPSVPSAATTAVAPSITTQPQSQTVTAGQSVTISVVAGGTAPLTYQWKKNSSTITGATSDSLTITNVQNANAGAYTVVVSNNTSSVVSDAATLTVTAAPVAPSIATQPQSQTIMAGSSVTFTVSATGTGPLIYKWEKNGVTVADTTLNRYTIANVTNSDAGTYSVVVRNSVDSVTSLNAVLTVTAVPVAPSITAQPQSQTITAGQTVTFSVAANGTAPLTYQWKKDIAVIANAMASSYSITNIQTGNAGKYFVIVTNSAGRVSSDSAMLTVTAATVAPSITTQPQSDSATAGQNVTFSVVASGTAPFTYQWKKDGVSISGATSSSLFLSSVQAANAGTYTVVVSNSAGNAVSNGAILTVTAAPTFPSITTQPQSQTVTVGQSVTFSMTATGAAPLSYQWKKNGNNISGATVSSFTISTAAVTDSGSYTVVVTNGTGIATSNPAMLTVNAAASSSTVTDTDGNVYQTVTIGTQVWMTTNLKTTRYNDGRAIPLVTDGMAWSDLMVQSAPGYCWYNDSISYGNTYGALYNWYAVNAGKLAPKGWHVPTDSEWDVLVNYIGGYATAGGPLKETGTTHWLSPNAGATNSSGFSALPGGYRIGNGTFTGIGNFGTWWSSTVYDDTTGYAPGSWYRSMLFNNTYVNHLSDGYPSGLGVRCVKD